MTKGASVCSSSRRRGGTGIRSIVVVIFVVVIVVQVMYCLASAPNCVDADHDE